MSNSGKKNSSFNNSKNKKGHLTNSKFGDNNNQIAKITPDFNAVIRIVFWNGLGFLFFNFLKTYAVLYHFGGSGIDLGFILAIQPLARLIITPLIGYLTDKVPKKNLILLGSLGRTTSYSLYYASLLLVNYTIFNIGIIVQGLLVGFFWTPYQTILAEKSYKAHRTEAYGKGRGKQVGKGYFVGALISFTIFGVGSYIDNTNYALIYSPLIIFAVINLVSGIYFNLRIDESLTYDKYIESLNISQDKIETGNENINSSLKTVFDSDSQRKTSSGFYIGFLLLLVAVLFYFTTGTFSTPFLKAFLIDNLETNYFSADNPIIPILIMVLYFPAQVISQLLTQKIGKICDKYNFAITITIITISRVIFTWFLINIGHPIGFAGVLIFYFICVISNTYLLQSIISRVSKTHRGKMFGLYQWIRMLGSVIGPLIGGFLYDINPSLPFIFAMYFFLSLIPIFLIGFWKLSPYMAEKI